MSNRTNNKEVGYPKPIEQFDNDCIVAKDRHGNGEPKEKTMRSSKYVKNTSSSRIQRVRTFLTGCRIKTRTKWYHAIFAFSFIALLVCLLQISLPPPFGLRQQSEDVAQQPFSDGCANGMESCICPRRTICADDAWSMVLLVLARCSVFFDYPLYMMLFLSKAHNINNALRRTPIREVVHFADMHNLHNMFGVVVGIESMIHAFFHLLRWGLRGNDIQLLWQTKTGISGLIACLITPLIVWPMVVPWLKKKISFELRKGLHFLSWAWALALCCHAPARIYWLIGIPYLIYVTDRVFGFFVRTYLCEMTAFERYGEGGVVVEFKHPNGFKSDLTPYVYVMLPWVSKFQWHAFTLFPHPTKANHSTLLIAASGDWTKKLHAEINAPTLKTAYIYGPFESEFSEAAINRFVTYRDLWFGLVWFGSYKLLVKRSSMDACANVFAPTLFNLLLCVVSASNCIAVASGIGITPTMSLVQRYNKKKRINMIWTCRDAGLVEYFLHRMDLSAITQYSFLLIFYTGHRDLVLAT